MNETIFLDSEPSFKVMSSDFPAMSWAHRFENGLIGRIPMLIRSKRGLIVLEVGSLSENPASFIHRRANRFGSGLTAENQGSLTRHEGLSP